MSLRKVLGLILRKTRKALVHMLQVSKRQDGTGEDTAIIPFYYTSMTRLQTI